MNLFTSRIFNSFEKNPDNPNTLIKKSKESKLKDEIDYFKNIPKSLQLYFPRYVNDFFSGETYHLELEYYAYEDLGVKMVYDDFDFNFWTNFFIHVEKYFKTYLQTTLNKADVADSISMFIGKTENEYKKLIEKNTFFSELPDKIKYNGKILKNFPLIWEKIKNIIIENFISENFYFIHGDFCFNNVIYGSNKKTNDIIFKFIDPRGKFGENYFYGDIYYDLAKISHSCNGGYEYFINDKFTFEKKNDEFLLKFSNFNKNNINKIFLEFVKNNNYNFEKIKTIEGCIFVSICARHYDNLERQKAMYFTGLEILNEIYEKI